MREIPIRGSAAAVSRQPDRHVESLAKAHQFEGDSGVYAVFATWNGRRVVCLSDHLDRLEDSARRTGFGLSLDREHLRRELRRLISDAGFQEVRLRISARPDSTMLTVAAEPYGGPPFALRESGVSCTTVPHHARENPRAKQSRWIDLRAALGSPSSESYELLLLDEAGAILEGASSNFYVIRPSGETPADRRATESRRDFTLQTADDGILPGISRSIVLSVASDVVDVALSPPLAADRHIWHEAFLTSASRGIVPIIRIDGEPVGSGEPGPVTAKLIRLYDERARELEEKL